MNKITIFALMLTCSNLVFAAFGSNETDGDYISLSGVVHKVGKNLFNMKVDGELVDVEFDSLDEEREIENTIKPQMEVAVYGRMDKEVEGSAKVEAGSIYIESLDKRIYADSNDEESYPVSSRIKKLKLNDNVSLNGEVTRVNKRDIIIDTGEREIAVRTDMTDKLGLEILNKGDHITVKGKVKSSLYNGKQIVADELKKL